MFSFSSQDMSRRVSCSGVALRLSSNISLRRTARGCCAAGWPAPTGRSPRRRCSRGSLTARCRRGATAYSCNPSGHGIISPTAATPADNPSCSCKLTRSGHEVARALQLRSLRMWGNPCCSCGLTRVRWRCSGSRNGRARSAAKQVGTILLQNGPDCLGLCLGVTRLRPGCPALHSAVLPTSSQPRCQSAPLLRPSPHVLTSIRQAAARPAVAELARDRRDPPCPCRRCAPVAAVILPLCCQLAVFAVLLAADVLQSSRTALAGRRQPRPSAAACGASTPSRQSGSSRRSSSGSSGHISNSSSRRHRRGWWRWSRGSGSKSSRTHLACRCRRRRWAILRRGRTSLRRCEAGLAVGETVLLLHPPLPVFQ